MCLSRTLGVKLSVGDNADHGRKVAEGYAPRRAAINRARIKFR
jgi:hypothetical protein